jgi:hypothetical protein
MSGLHLIKLFLAQRLTIYQNIIHYLHLKQLMATPAPARSLITIIDERKFTFRAAPGALHTNHSSQFLLVTRRYLAL